MGKGKRLRKERGEERGAPPAASPRQEAFIANTIATYDGHLTLRQQTGGWQVLMAYLSYLAEAGREIDADLARLQKQSADASSAEVADLLTRLDQAKAALPDDVRYGEHRDGAAEAIALIEPRDAFPAVTAIRIAPLKFGPILSGWPAPAQDWRPGTIPILKAVCDPALYQDAVRLIDLRLNLYEPNAGAEEVDAYTQAADRALSAALHAEAALSAWLIRESGLVAEPARAYLRISEAALRAYGQDIPPSPA